MCDPGTIIAASAFAVQAGSAVANASAQAKQRNANKTAAEQAQAQTYRALDLRAAQEKDAATQTIMQADRQARSTDALARVGAGAAGVSGASVDAMLAGIASDKFSAEQTIKTNLGNDLTQISAEKRGADATATNRIAATPGANPFLTGLQIAGAGLDFGTTYLREHDTTKGSA